MPSRDGVDESPCDALRAQDPSSWTIGVAMSRQSTTPMDHRGRTLA
jgi:hypothetical protein